MYRLGEVKHSHRKLYATLLGFVVLTVVAGLLAWRMLKPTTEISQAPAAVTTKISYDTTKLATFETPLFTFRLPATWKLVTRSADIPAPDYTWQGTSRDDANRWISVYIDKNLSTFAVNRELSIQANVKKLNVLSDVSENCTTFTGADTQTHGSTPAKWQGVNFLCDTGNYQRDVVGLASGDGLNNVNFSGHKLFITYTDNAPSADYSIFINAIKSLQAK